MKIDVTRLLTNSIDSIYVEENVEIPKNLLLNSRIDDLKNVIVKGKLKLDEDDNLLIDAQISGAMVLKDDVTLESVEYNFSTEFEENLEKKQNILDITDVLWQNILVEIPSKVRSTDEDIELSGDGWRVISEDKFNEERNKANNPFSNLEELLRTKEDK